MCVCVCVCVCVFVCVCVCVWVSVCVCVWVSVWMCVCDKTSPPEKKIPEIHFSQTQWNVYVRRKVVSILPMKAHRGSRGKAPLTLNLGVKWKWEVNFITWPLHSLGKSLGNHWTVGKVGPRAYLDVIEERKILFTLSEFELRTVQPVAYLLYRLRHTGSQNCIH